MEVFDSLPLNITEGGMYHPTSIEYNHLIIIQSFSLRWVAYAWEVQVEMWLHAHLDRTDCFYWWQWNEILQSNELGVRAVE